jgi:hypothetical protein
LYTFQCSSSLLTSFSYVFIYRYLISGLIAPIILLILKYIQHICIQKMDVSTQTQSTEESSESASHISSADNIYVRIFDLTTTLCPIMWKMVDELEVYNANDSQGKLLNPIQ